jgi:hypothetical protein
LAAGAGVGVARKKESPGCHLFSLPTPASLGLQCGDPSTPWDAHHEYVGFEGSGSGDPGLLGSVTDSKFTIGQPIFPVPEMEQTFQIADTFYSEVGGVDLHDTAVFPKVCMSGQPSEFRGF